MLAIVAVAITRPPSDQIGIKSVQMEEERLVAMKRMNMDWVPYIPMENRDSEVLRLRSQVYILSCTQRRAALRHLKEDQRMVFQYCNLYFCNPLNEDEHEQRTVIDIVFEPKPVVCQFDWDMDELEEFTDELIEIEVLSGDEKAEFKEFVRSEVRKAKIANQEAREARRRAREEMSPEDRAAFENMRIYKFYPKENEDFPVVLTCRNINRYYPKAEEVL